MLILYPVIHHPVCVNASIISLRYGFKISKKFLKVTFAFEDSFALMAHECLFLFHYQIPNNLDQLMQFRIFLANSGIFAL